MREFTAYEEFIYKSRYARWIGHRREEWPETVSRVVDYLKERVARRCGFNPISKDQWSEIEEAILNRDVMPSMRVMMTAGVALSQNDIAAYNCSYLDIDAPEAFAEALYVLMHGTGLGFGVSQELVGQLPVVKEMNHDLEPITYDVPDSKEGWRESVDFVIACGYNGVPLNVDYSNVRPAGARLSTFGGRASGPEPLAELHGFIAKIFKQAQGRQLTTVECHDIICKIGECVVVGGVRRSALISLSDLEDTNMATAKSGEWWVDNNQRALANNSAVYNGKPSKNQFLNEWGILRDSGSGERGIFNLESAGLVSERYGRDGSRVRGTNPCGEILLRDGQFCNLTEVVIRANDSAEELERKVRVASILGTIQSTFDNIKGLRDKWVDNTKEERLLGVSLTGIMDNDLTNNTNCAELLDALRILARDTNTDYAGRLGVEVSAAITTVKPSGTVSQLVGSSSGIHPAHASSYIRRVRVDIKDPICDLLEAEGIPCEIDFYNDKAKVFSFPIRRPGKTRDDMTAIEFLEIWKVYKEHWTEHNPSVTVSVKEDEWEEVGEWVFENFDMIGGLSFLPYDGGTYQQAPYETVDEEDLPDEIAVDFSDLDQYEDAKPELACTAGACEI